jgi:polysaccharide deacetylase family protein (PEP-CTERM system associated)
MKNAISIDVEDWHHNIIADYSTWSQFEDRVVHSTDIVLRLLRETGVRATFFTMGYVADHHPELIARIADEGHEVECHGYYHQFVYHLTPEQFRDDVCRTRDAIEAITGRRPVGYRAPYFSITRESWWALDVLAELGFRYDSSIFPVHNHRYGVPDAPRHPYHIQTEKEASLTELPSSTLHWGINWPMAGGVYFRALPYPFIKRAVRRINDQGQSALLYVHPWEFDPEQPIAPGMHPLFRARRYLNLDKTERKWRGLLTDFEFGPVGEVFQREINGG